MKIIIDEVPLSKNKYVNMHWSKRAKYKERISWLIHKQKMIFYKEDSIHNLPYIKAKITFNIYFKYKRRRDIQNFVGGGLIAWLDVLVDLKFIKDDSYEVIGQPIITFNIDKEFPRTEIKIERRD